MKLINNRVYAISVILLFTIPNLFAIIKGRESYPFTPAPMFSHYVGSHSNFYDFVFVAEADTTEKVVLPVHEEHKNQLAIKRFFFDRVYGSVEENSPLWNKKNDTKDEFEQRLSKFFTVYFKQAEIQNFKNIRLELKEYDHEYKETATHVIGFYNLITKQFRQTWSNPL